LRDWLPGCVALGAAALVPTAGTADEGGTSVWLPGSFGSLAAVPQAPGWSLATIYYHTSLSAGADVSAAREISIGRFTPTLTTNLNASLNARADLALLVPGYVFATPVFGGQAAVSMTGIIGGSSASVSGTLSGFLGPLAFSRSANVGDSIAGAGDLFPQASLRWSWGAHNVMTYLQADLPVGSYRSTRLANLGVGHWAVDGGAGYTYFNSQTGHEFSAVAGITGNTMNPSTNYQSGTDFHLDWGASQFLSERWHVGAVGYIYDQITGDSGTGDRVGSFESRVLAAGPQIGYIFTISDRPAYLNLKGYKEFAATHRPSGWNLWLTLSITLGEPNGPAN
jgi:hypothetical protein